MSGEEKGAEPEAALGIDDHAIAGMLEYLVGVIERDVPPLKLVDEAEQQGAHYLAANVREAKKRARWLRERAARAERRPAVLPAACDSRLPMIGEGNRARFEAFLFDLSALSERHGVVITGCTDGACHCSMSLESFPGKAKRPIEYTHDRGCGPILASAPPDQGGDPR